MIKQRKSFSGPITLQKASLNPTLVQTTLRTGLPSMAEVMASAGKIEVPSALKSFIKDNPSPTKQAIELAYGKKSLSRVRSDFNAAKSYKIQIIKEVQKLKKAVEQMLGTKKLPADTQAEYDAKISYIGNFIDLMEPYIEMRAFQDADKKADAEAVARGYKDAEDAQAQSEVEAEWYFKMYNTKDPFQILAYKKVERRKYGRTSYEAAILGEQLIPIGSVEQAEVIAEGEEVVDKITDDVAEAESDKAKKMQMVYYIGIPALLIGGYFLYRSRK